MRSKLQSVATGIALVLLSAGGPALAQDSDTAALEARVAELEAMVRQLAGKDDASPAATPAPAPSSSSTTYKFGGYAKFDAMFSDYSDATPPGDSLIRQFYWAPGIPIGDGSASSDISADFQARETRLNFKVDHTTENGHQVGGFIELDFFTHVDGSEVVSNSYSPRLRHAFLKFDKWTVGQTWSTFQDVAALPEALDFIGPAESTTFIRQAMVRYTTGNLELALENPQTFVSGGTRDLSTMPDIIARYTFKLDGGSYVKLAGLVRSLKIQNDTSGSQADATAWGISASTKFVFDNGDDLRAMVNYGDGIGRYVGLGFVPDGVRNALTGDIETAESLSWFVAYRHLWNSKWRSNIMYGTNSIDYENDLNAAALNDNGSSFHVNVIYNVLPKLDVGAEILWAEREIVSGTDGDFTRLMLSAKYAF
ncbi:MAG: DcaP family trimeric outer membrane transporter [Woeseiaceae bacterium]